MKDIFVFGSNYAGRHGAGAAKFAVEHHSAIYGQGEGLQGNSYAIPTKDAKLRSLDLSTIAKHIQKFLSFANEHGEMTFQVTPIGTGLAGYSDEDIAPMFRGAPDNCIFLRETWEKYR